MSKFKVPGELILELRMNGEITHSDFTKVLSNWVIVFCSVPSEPGKSFCLVDKVTKENMPVVCVIEERNSEAVRLIKSVPHNKLNLPLTPKDINETLNSPKVRRENEIRFIAKMARQKRLVEELRNFALQDANKSR